MDTVLVDTDVFSYIHKKDTRAELYRTHLEGKRLALSFMTVAEVYCWAVERNWGAKKIEELRSKL
jgi:tRNA(fMet)-specific endonuclease VapC